MKPAHGPRRCTATTRRGLPCKAWAVPDTNPPTCAAHRATPRPGARIGNTNARKHGAHASTAHQNGAGLQPIIADLSTLRAAFVMLGILQGLVVVTFLLALRPDRKP